MPKVKHYIDSIYYDVELTAYAMRMLGRQLFENLNLGSVNNASHLKVYDLSRFPP